MCTSVIHNLPSWHWKVIFQQGTGKTCCLGGGGPSDLLLSQYYRWHNITTFQQDFMKIGNNKKRNYYLFLSTLILKSSSVFSLWFTAGMHSSVFQLLSMGHWLHLIHINSKHLTRHFESSEFSPGGKYWKKLRVSTLAF